MRGFSLPHTFLVHLFLLLGFAAADGEGEGRQMISAMTSPGFLYTRTRGRCLPQFWSSRREAWPKMVPQMSSVSKIFGSQAAERYRAGLTLLEAARKNDDQSNAFSRLLKQSTAALLNSYARKGYPYSAWEVKTLLIRALVSEEAAVQQAHRFGSANQACS